MSRKKELMIAALDMWHPSHGKTAGDQNIKHQPKKDGRRYTPSGLPLPPKAKKKKRTKTQTA